jgi:TPR repeat protein
MFSRRGRTLANPSKFGYTEPVPRIIPTLLFALCVGAQAQVAPQATAPRNQNSPRPGQALLPPPVAPGIETPRRTNAEPAEVRAALTNSARLSAKTNLQARVAAERDRVNRNALQWQIERAAEGSAVAMRSLGQRYMTGDLVEKDQAKAREWLKKAADAGDGGAVVLLEKLDRTPTNSPPDRISKPN